MTSPTSSSSSNEPSSSLQPRDSISAASGSTIVVERNDACKADETSKKHAVILDISLSSTGSSYDMTFKKPSIDELLHRGPAAIMNGAAHRKPSIRWVHLRSNVMFWVEQLMDRVCEERRIQVPDNPSKRPGSPTRLNPMLRKDLWYHLFHGKASDQIQTRFMGPACTPFSVDVEDEQSDSSSEADAGATRGPRNNLVMYMPYLNWESVKAWDERQQLIGDINGKRSCRPQADTEFVRDYLHHNTSPLHDRRTLHQAYYHDFGMTRPLPDYDQVMHRFTAKLDEGEAKLVIVDQLWLWVIKGGTFTDGDSAEAHPDLVVTAFPQRFNGEYNSADIYHGIIQHLERGLEPSLRTINDLVALIVEHCTGVFFQRQLESDKWFMEFFAAAIGLVRDDKTAAFNKFCVAVQELERLQARQASLIELSRKLESSDFSIALETGLFKEIKDIIDELGCIDYILARQEDVVKSLTRTYRSRAVKNVSEMVSERKESWKRIAETAQVAYNEIQAQMDIKQKQSSLAEARSNRYQAEDSARHGRIMLLFTVVTIIFLPLSFMATWFGMNVKGLEDNSQLNLALIAAIIFPVSVVIAIVALAFAFSERLRDRTAGIIEKILDTLLACLPVHGSESAARRRRSQVRDMGRPPRWDVRIRGTDPDMEMQ
ncbi:uncharacterized protein AB675_1243 [Cyphellophora attinorum]|uniref:Magnesium transport protein CorA n=1 Tax=Cyphellophora attinorum TaxID=1664694 RepID=A0A0N1HI89_9EURO|nr:uncharacterized protein AB675_1243 [Phialophora attinorum]KPI35743.1 hypothetical protein AB675_1243 [Phialophora attinorum]